jgi:CelD/BcsL family acetyltransferase involved in cellulose biosynthesis
VEVCPDPTRYLDEWTRLYAGLAERHRLEGIRAFSRAAFERQLAMPGMVAVRAERAGAVVGMALWLSDPPSAHYHLAAYSNEGYEVSASYAVFELALRHLRELGVRLVDMGGSADTGQGDGLDRFKRGWANEERVAHLCGRVLDRPAYERLAAGRAGGWFPAYRDQGTA